MNVLTINHGLNLRDDKPEAFVIREWDGSLKRVVLVQIHGNGQNKFMSGVTIKYQDGLQHIVSLRYFCSIVVAQITPTIYRWCEMICESVVEQPRRLERIKLVYGG